MILDNEPQLNQESDNVRDVPERVTIPSNPDPNLFSTISETYDPDTVPSAPDTSISSEFTGSEDSNK